MKLTKVVAVAAALVLAAQAVQAQVYGVPFYPTPTGTGASASADYGKPEDGSAVALTGGLGLPRLGVTATVGRYSISGTEEMSFGGSAALRLFGGGLMPVSVQAQAGFGTIDLGGTTGRVTNIPVGLAVRVSPPLFPLKPFAVAYYTLGDGVEEELRVNVGANFNLLLGLGFHAAYDWGDSGSTFGLGAHFNFRLPVPVM